MLEENAEQLQSLKELIEAKEKYVEEGKYAEAEQVKMKIEELKNSTNYKKTGILHESQEKEREDLENDYENERRELEEKWDKKIQEFVDNGKKSEEDLVKTHEKKMKEYVTKMTANYPRIKYSQEYLNGRVQEMHLAKAERYKEAAQKKKINDRLQEQENEKYENERSANITKNAESLGIKQENDLNVLRARLARTYDLLTAQKDKDLEKLDSKFKNRKQELVGLQKRQRNISENINLDRAWEGSKRLTNMALSNKKDDISAKDDNAGDVESQSGQDKKLRKKNKV